MQTVCPRLTCVRSDLADGISNMAALYWGAKPALRSELAQCIVKWLDKWADAAGRHAFGQVWPTGMQGHASPSHFFLQRRQPKSSLVWTGASVLFRFLDAHGSCQPGTHPPCVRLLTWSSDAYYMYACSHAGGSQQPGPSHHQVPHLPDRTRLPAGQGRPHAETRGHFIGRVLAPEGRASGERARGRRRHSS